MIRATEVNFTRFGDFIKTEIPTWRQAISYLSDNQPLFKKFSSYCQLADQILHSTPLKPIMGFIGLAERNLVQASEYAKTGKTFIPFIPGQGLGLNLVTDQILHSTPLKPITGSIALAARNLVQASEYAKTGKTFIAGQGLGLNLVTAKELLPVADMGLDLMYWFSTIERLGTSISVASKLTSMKLGLAILSPTVHLIMLLRSEGLKALEGPELYKQAYKLGLSLLAIYVFMTAVTLSSYLHVAIASINFAMEYKDQFYQAYQAYSSAILELTS